jgi:rubrerythrin
VSGTEAQIIEIMRDQIKVEKVTLNRLVRLEEEARETVVRLAFLELRLDTWKHIKFLEGMIEHLTTTPCDEWSAKVARYSGRVKLEREIEALINEEDEMVKLLDKAIEKISDPIAQLMLKNMRDEEHSHRMYLADWVKLIQQTPLQTKKGQKGTDIVCETD